MQEKTVPVISDNATSLSHSLSVRVSELFETETNVRFYMPVWMSTVLIFDCFGTLFVVTYQIHKN